MLADVVRPGSARFMGPPASGRLWDCWLAAYYADRVLVSIDVHRVIS